MMVEDYLEGQRALKDKNIYVVNFKEKIYYMEYIKIGVAKGPVDVCCLRMLKKTTPTHLQCAQFIMLFGMIHSC